MSVKQIDFSQVPQLDESSLNKSLGQNLGQNLNTSNVSDREAFGENKLIGQVRNLERFCTEVVSNKLFWTPEILNFF